MQTYAELSKYQHESSQPGTLTRISGNGGIMRHRWILLRLLFANEKLPTYICTAYVTCTSSAAYVQIDSYFALTTSGCTYVVPFTVANTSDVLRNYVCYTFVLCPRDYVFCDEWMHVTKNAVTGVHDEDSNSMIAHHDDHDLRCNFTVLERVWCRTICRAGF